jgi:hypothetical protein
MLILNNDVLDLLRRTTERAEAAYEGDVNKRPNIHRTVTKKNVIVYNGHWMFLWPLSSVSKQVALKKLGNGDEFKTKVDDEILGKMFPDAHFIPCDEVDPTKLHLKKRVIVYRGSKIEAAFRSGYVSAAYQICTDPEVELYPFTWDGNLVGTLVFREGGVIVACIAPTIL